jgi:predicted DNA-binding WGR domain protein
VPVKNREIVQLPLFMENACMKKDGSYYTLSIQKDLFGGAALVRCWGRSGRKNMRRCENYRNEGEAANALAEIVTRHRKRGYNLVH